MATLELVYVDGSSDTAETKDLPGLERLLVKILRSPSCTDGLLRYELRDGGKVLKAADFSAAPALSPIAAAIGGRQ